MPTKLSRLGVWIVKVLDEGGIRLELLEPGEAPVKFIIKIPLLLQVLALAVLYISAASFSFIRWVSLWVPNSS